MSSASKDTLARHHSKAEGSHWKFAALGHNLKQVALGYMGNSCPIKLEIIAKYRELNRPWVFEKGLDSLSVPVFALAIT